VLAPNKKKSMSKLIYLDVETTGLEDEDRLCEVAYCVEQGEMHQAYFKPPLPIKVGAMAVSHVTNKMVEDKEVFKESSMCFDLATMATQDFVMVAHNAPFDLRMLKYEGISFPNYIDTKKLSHALDPEDKMESHRMQYLRYYFGIEMEEAVAHTADGDVAVLRAVHAELVKRLGNPSIEEQMEISARPILYSVFKFGKYRDQMIGDIARTNPQYIEWLLGQKKENGQDEADWIYTLEHYLRNHA
jgi:exodeoxyribonuclease X